MPLHAEEALGWGPAEIGIVFTITGAMTLFTLMPAAWAADHISRRFQGPIHKVMHCRSWLEGNDLRLRSRPAPSQTQGAKYVS